MANTLLTPTIILREAGRLFHQKAKFLRTINREYSDQFAQTGAKVGYSIQLRNRNQFTVSTGATLQVQDVSEVSQTLAVNTQKHVGMNFVSADLTMVIDDFSKRYIEPAMAVLVANIEADAITMRNKVWNYVDDGSSAFQFSDFAKGKRKLDENLTPEDDERYALLCPQHGAAYLDAVKTLYNPQSEIGSQYRSGVVKDVTGFNVMASTQMVPHQSGSATTTTGYTVSSYSTATSPYSTSTVTITGGSTNFLAGDVVTFSTCNAVHPETKASYGYAQQFTIVSDSGNSASSIVVSPGIVLTGAKQNVSAGPSGGVVKVGGVANTLAAESLIYHKDAFTFGSADLEDMSRYGGWGARESFDGVSLRIWRQGDIVNDAAPCRIDVLYGFLARYPHMAARLRADG